jgi:FAD/FMN-containing dehydrogenase
LGEPNAGNDLLRGLRAPLKPEVDNVKVMSYFEAQAAGFRPAPFAHFQSNVFLPELTAAAVEAITTAVKNAPAQFRVLIVPFFGAITRVSVSETAFALRQPGFEVDILGSWSAPAEKPSAVQWVKALRDSLKPFAHGVYVNQLGETSEELVRSAYGSNYARLAEIKRKYDPQNVLRLNQNIKPTSAVSW